MRGRLLPPNSLLGVDGVVNVSAPMTLSANQSVGMWFTVVGVIRNFRRTPFIQRH